MIDTNPLMCLGKKKPTEIIYSNHLHEDKNKIDRHFFLLHRTPCGEEDLGKRKRKKEQEIIIIIIVIPPVFNRMK